MAISKRKSIPDKVKQVLRDEVGFGCPVKGCGNPYLEYHHFDPPVNVRSHNEPSGMIALCAQHHKKADGYAYTVDQLHQLKSDKTNAKIVRGNLDWLRRDLIAVVGGNFYHETPIPIFIDNTEVISLKRDDDGYLRLSINMLSVLPEERIIIDSNSWENIGQPFDLRCPPQGKELEVKYHNGDYLYLRFLELTSAEEGARRYSTDVFNSHIEIDYPITIVEINMSIGGTSINLTSSETTFASNTIKGGFMSHCGVGISLHNTGLDWLQNPKWKLDSKIEHVEGTNIIKVRFGR